LLAGFDSKEIHDLLATLNPDRSRNWFPRLPPYLLVVLPRRIAAGVGRIIEATPTTVLMVLWPLMSSGKAFAAAEPKTGTASVYRGSELDHSGRELPIVDCVTLVCVALHRAIEIFVLHP